MIHHELGHAYVPTEDGHEAVEMRTPLDFLLGAELIGDDETAAVRVEAVRDFHAWVCERDPHPRHVARRLVCASLHFCPGAVAGLSPAEAQAVRSEDFEIQQRCVMRVLLGRPRAGARMVAAHAEAIHQTLAKAHHRRGRTALRLAPSMERSVDVLLGEDAGPEERAIRRETLRGWLRPMWRAGSLGEALKAFYAITRKIKPELILNMTSEEVASFFDQTRAAAIEREHRLINLPLERHTGRHVTLLGQRSTLARAAYAGAQKGNTHRADSVRLAA